MSVVNLIEVNPRLELPVPSSTRNRLNVGSPPALSGVQLVVFHPVPDGELLRFRPIERRFIKGHHAAIFAEDVAGTPISKQLGDRSSGLHLLLNPQLSRGFALGIPDDLDTASPQTLMAKVFLVFHCFPDRKHSDVHSFQGRKIEVCLATVFTKDEPTTQLCSAA
jgi:hypothetical protein